jgi:hypothetical protein
VNSFREISFQESSTSRDSSEKFMYEQGSSSRLLEPILLMACMMSRDERPRRWRARAGLSGGSEESMLDIMDTLVELKRTQYVRLA